MENNSLCDLLRNRRIQLGYSLEYTSELVGVSMIEVEQGLLRLNSSHLCLFSKVLELDVNKLYQMNLH